MNTLISLVTNVKTQWYDYDIQIKYLDIYRDYSICFIDYFVFDFFY